MSPKPCYCINPACQQPDHPDNNNSNTPYCLSCGSQLLLNRQFRVSRLLSDDSGFGNVYEAFQGFSANILKVLKPEWNREPKAIELFKQEYAVLKELSQQGVRGIPQAESYFEYPTKSGLKLYCLVMEKVEGIDLVQWLKNNGKVNQTQALKWLREIILILDKIHRKNYFHRDIKPPNIMMRNNGDLVLIDFGTAREETRTYYQKVQGGQVTGITSAGYTPIEQQNGQAVAQSDFFALGRTFVHLLTGKHPCDRSMYDPMRDVLIWRGHTENINPLLLDLIDDLMARLAAARPQNTHEILQRLDRLEQNLKQPQNPVPPPVPSPPPPPQPRSQNAVSPTVQISPPQFPKKPIINSWIVVGSITLLGLGIVSLRQPSSVVTTKTPTVQTSPTILPEVTITPSHQVTENQSGQITPQESVLNYYNAINNGDYASAWEKLPISLQNDRGVHPNGYKSFADWFSQIRPISVLKIYTVENDGNTAIVAVSSEGRQTKVENLSYYLIWNQQTKNWDFEKIK